MNTTDPQISVSGAEEHAATDQTASIETCVDPQPVLGRPTDDGGMPVSSSFRWWLGVAVALAVAVPLSWLLALAVNLPFFLGLFFFALFGLIIGAACFRVSHNHQPYPRNTVLAGTTLIILATWGGALFFEAQSFGQAMALEAVAAGGLNLKGTTIFEYRARVRSEVQGYLAERYPPGGTLGYVRWAAGSGEIPAGMLASVKKGLRTNQRGWWWIGRVAISIMLLAFGVGSQVFALRAPR